MLTILVIFSLVIGSFLNVVISRVHQGLSIRGRSRCPYCSKNIAWYDLIPLVSFIVLLGRCRRCKKAISVRYPIVEMLSGFFLPFLFILFSGLGVGAWIFRFFLLELFLAILVIDAENFIIPHILIATGFIGAIIYYVLASSVLRSILDPLASFHASYLLTALLTAALLMTVWYISRGKWFGFGDITLLVLLGFIFGFVSMLVIWYLAVLSATIASLALIITRRASMKSKIAFGSYLSAGAIAVILLPGYFEGYIVLLFKYLIFI